MPTCVNHSKLLVKCCLLLCERLLRGAREQNLGRNWKLKLGREDLYSGNVALESTASWNRLKSTRNGENTEYVDISFCWRGRGWNGVCKLSIMNLFCWVMVLDKSDFGIWNWHVLLYSEQTILWKFPLVRRTRLEGGDFRGLGISICWIVRSIISRGKEKRWRMTYKHLSAASSMLVHT